MYNMKKITTMFLGALFTLIMLGSVQQVLAASVPPRTVASLQAQLDKLIANRIKSLNSNIANFNKEKNIPASRIADVNASITALNTLKTKIDGETTMQALIADEQQIFRGVGNTVSKISPQERTITTLQKGLTTITKQIATLTARITTAQTAGIDTTGLQAKLDDATAKINDATTQLAQADTTAKTVVPADGNKTITASNKTIQGTVENNISAVQTDIRGAEKDIHTVLVTLNPPKKAVKE